jgi:hypothetical protein
MAFAHFLHITFLYQERIQNLSVRAQAALKAHIKELIASPRQGRIVIFEGACTGVFGFEDDIDLIAFKLSIDQAQHFVYHTGHHYIPDEYMNTHRCETTGNIPISNQV